MTVSKMSQHFSISKGGLNIELEKNAPVDLPLNFLHLSKILLLQMDGLK